MNPHRLPRTVIPRSYDLRLAPDLEAASFTGSVRIDVEITEPTSTIVLNAVELTLDAVTVHQNGAQHLPSAVVLDDEYERATITLDTTLEPGDAVVEISFTGVLNDKLTGFYRSTWTDDAGRRHTLATTQFESTSARRAFPCWDEPDLKAVFTITLDVDADLMAVSCQSETANEDLGNGRRAVTFAPTPVLSTYLLAWVVGELEATEPVTGGGVPMRIIHVPGRADKTAFALDAARFAMDWLSEYFDLPYPGDKCDLIAIPDFAFGAMENLGCVTFREVLLLIDPDGTTQPEQQRSVDVIAHEIAHMWFGDLVTMKWWNGLWLKEAFATFMEMLVTDAYRPDWNRWVDFGLSRTEAFRVDSLTSTRPVEFEVQSPEDAEAMYDVLTYEKGAAVVRMLEQYLGEEAFRDGVRLYLRRHAFGNTETHDLWDALEEATGQPVRRIMDSWIFQGGYPLVKVDTTDDNLVLTQSQFRYEDETDTRWAVPVILTCGRNGTRTDSRALLDGDTTTVGPDTAPDWVAVNTRSSGFYRVAYSDDLLAGTLDHLDALEPIERYSLIDDLWTRAVAGDASIASVIGAIARFGDETDLSVWQRIIGVINSIDALCRPEDRAAVASFTRTLAQPAGTRLGPAPVAGESERANELRAALLGLLGVAGADPDARARAREIFETPDADASLGAAGLRVVAHHGTDDDYAEVLSRFRNAGSPQEERRAMYALAGFPAAHHMDGLLEMTVNGDVRTQDGAYLLATAMRNRTHGARAWRFVTEHWATFVERLPANSLPRVFSGVTALSHGDLPAEVEQFMTANPLPQGALSMAQDLEQLHVNVALRSRVESETADALAAL